MGQFHVSVYTASIDTSLHEVGHESDAAAPGGDHPWNLKVKFPSPTSVLFFCYLYNSSMIIGLAIESCL